MRVQPDELRDIWAELRKASGMLDHKIEELIQQIRVQHGEVALRLTMIQEGQTAQSDRIEDTRNEMHLLHEDVIQRLALIQEGQAASKARRRKR